MGCSSEYYPPRGGWRSPLRVARYKTRTAIRQTFRLEPSDTKLPLGRTFLSLVVPGYAFLADEVPLTGQTILVLYLVLCTAFLMWLGYPVAGVCLGVAIALHVVSIYFSLRRFTTAWTFGQRCAMAFVLVIAVGGLLYGSAHALMRSFVMPLRAHDRVFVVQTSVSPENVNRGDSIAYKIKAFSGEGYYVAQGFGMGKVQASAGDTIRFNTNHFEVNGTPYPRHPMMPQSGELIVPELHWFVWPDYAMEQRGRAAQFQVSDALARLGTVSEEAFVGRVFDRWFWRKQEIP